jgi:hypothetical protein
MLMMAMLILLMAKIVTVISMTVMGIVNVPRDCTVENMNVATSDSAGTRQNLPEQCDTYQYNR